jgi:hypothetical protein
VILARRQSPPRTARPPLCPTTPRQFFARNRPAAPQGKPLAAEIRRFFSSLLDRFVSKAMDFFEILAFDADQPG